MGEKGRWIKLATPPVLKPPHHSPLLQSRPFLLVFEDLMWVDLLIDPHAPPLHRTPDTLLLPHECHGDVGQVLNQAHAWLGESSEAATKPSV